MASSYFIQSSFNSGEWSDRLEGRVDLAKYANALYRMENFLVDPRGPAIFRPGLKYISGTKTNSTASRLIPFEFSVTQAYILEFGNGYIRFYRNQAQIQVAYAAWVTGTAYAPGNLVTNAGSYYRCIVAHSAAAAFATDLAAGKWAVTAGATDLAYEIPSPYVTADLSGVKYCQSADVLYLFHSSYATRKLSRASHTSWTLAAINFRPPALKEIGEKPATTLIMGALSGTGVQFAAGAAVFLSGDVKRVIVSGVGRASITAFISTNTVTCEIIDAFASVGPIASQSWSMEGSPSGYLKPSVKEPAGAICQLTSQTSAETTTNLLTHNDPPDNNWVASGAVAFPSQAYYLKNTAAGYSTDEPDYVYAFMGGDPGVGKLTKGSLTLGIGLNQWAWGDADALGYNTIYVIVFDVGIELVTDPDTLSTASSPHDDYCKRGDIIPIADLFRSTDVGKYVRIHNGLVKITVFTSAKAIQGEILKTLSATDSTPLWSLESEAWTVANGYPSCGTFFEERFCVAGSVAFPETVWGSQVGDYENFTPGVDDADAFEFTLAGRQVNVIRWIEPREYLIIGTAGAEWRLGPEDTGKALTPLNVVAKQQTSFGSYNIMPETVSTATLFLQRAGTKIREFTYQWESNGYVAPDLTVLAEHVMKDGIRGISFQQEPYSTLWAYTADGSLISMTYIREQEVVGWQRHPMGTAVVESLATIPGTGYDEVWAIVKRTVNGSTVRYVEMLTKIFDDTPEAYISNKGLNAFFVDSGITYNGASTATITGLSHLEGQTVVILADGNTQASKVVTGGQITLSAAATVVHVGLSYTGILQPMRLDAALRDGTAQGRLKKIHEVGIRVYRSGAFKAGRDEANLDIVIDRDRTIILGAPYDLFTGDLLLGYDDRWEKNARIMIVQDKPMPLTVVAIMPEVSIS